MQVSLTPLLVSPPVWTWLRGVGYRAWQNLHDVDDVNVDVDQNDHSPHYGGRGCAGRHDDHI